MADAEDEYPTGKEAYIALADEFDPTGWTIGTPLPKVEDFDEAFVVAARNYASAHGLPLPWALGSIDEAERLVEEQDEKPRWVHMVY